MSNENNSVAASDESKNAVASKAARKPAAKQNKSAPAVNGKPNLQFVGKQKRWNKKAKKQIVVPRDAPAFIIDGRERIKLPKDLHKATAVDEATAQRVKQLFPQDFKTPTAK